MEVATLYRTLDLKVPIVVIILSVQAAPAKKPHILFLMVDDWGWANAGYHHNDIDSSKEVVTPNFDNLVKEGLVLEQHYIYKI